MAAAVAPSDVPAQTQEIGTGAINGRRGSMEGPRDADCVKVAVRCRPLLPVDAGLPSCVQVTGASVSIADELTRSEKKFTFDGAFAPEAAQSAVYDAFGPTLIDAIVAGYNATVLAYGQTGSGKSFTMFGTSPATHVTARAPRTVQEAVLPEGAGFIPRLCAQLFDHTRRTTSSAEEDCVHRVEAAYFQIYNERVFDLLAMQVEGSAERSGGAAAMPAASASLDLDGSSNAGINSRLRVREHPETGPFVEGLSWHAVEGYTQLERLITSGNLFRAVAATNMNATSSRSHAVVMLRYTLTRVDKATNAMSDLSSKINLVDLAGSERVGKTGAEGQRLKEAGSINKSLTSLGIVIGALAQRSESTSGGPVHVPYRDSTLTWLLKDSLGGNARTLMLATISPSLRNQEESLSTLRYADRAKRIRNKAVVNEDPNAALIRQLRDELAALRSEMAALRASGAGSNERVVYIDNPALKEELEALRVKNALQDRLLQQMHVEWEARLKATSDGLVAREAALRSIGIGSPDGPAASGRDRRASRSEAGDAESSISEMPDQLAHREFEVIAAAEWEDGDWDAASHDTGPRPTSSRLAPVVLGTPPKPRNARPQLVLLHPDPVLDRQMVCFLRDGDTRIGAGPDNDVRLSGPGIGLHHCVLSHATHAGAEVVLRLLVEVGQLVFVNGVPVASAWARDQPDGADDDGSQPEPTESAEGTSLQDGDRLVLGDDKHVFLLVLSPTNADSSAYAWQQAVDEVNRHQLAASGHRLSQVGAEEFEGQLALEEGVDADTDEELTGQLDGAIVTDTSSQACDPELAMLEATSLAIAACLPQSVDAIDVAPGFPTHKPEVYASADTPAAGQSPASTPTGSSAADEAVHGQPAAPINATTLSSDAPRVEWPAPEEAKTTDAVSEDVAGAQSGDIHNEALAPQQEAELTVDSLLVVSQEVHQTPQSSDQRPVLDTETSPQPSRKDMLATTPDDVDTALRTAARAPRSRRVARDAPPPPPGMTDSLLSPRSASRYAASSVAATLATVRRRHARCVEQLVLDWSAAGIAQSIAPGLEWLAADTAECNALLAAMGSEFKFWRSAIWVPFTRTTAAGPLGFLSLAAARAGTAAYGLGASLWRVPAHGPAHAASPVGLYTAAEIASWLPLIRCSYHCIMEQRSPVVEQLALKRVAAVVPSSDIDYTQASIDAVSTSAVAVPSWWRVSRHGTWSRSFAVAAATFSTAPLLQPATARTAQLIRQLITPWGDVAGSIEVILCWSTASGGLQPHAEVVALSLGVPSEASSSVMTAHSKLTVNLSWRTMLPAVVPADEQVACPAWFSAMSGSSRVVLHRHYADQYRFVAELSGAHESGADEAANRELEGLSPVETAILTAGGVHVELSVQDAVPFGANPDAIAGGQANTTAPPLGRTENSIVEQLVRDALQPLVSMHLNVLIDVLEDRTLAGGEGAVWSPAKMSVKARKDSPAGVTETRSALSRAAASLSTAVSGLRGASADGSTQFEPTFTLLVPAPGPAATAAAEGGMRTLSARNLRAFASTRSLCGQTAQSGMSARGVKVVCTVHQLLDDSPFGLERVTSVRLTDLRYVQIAPTSASLVELPFDTTLSSSEPDCVIDCNQRRDVAGRCVSLTCSLDPASLQAKSPVIMRALAWCLQHPTLQGYRVYARLQIGLQVRGCSREIAFSRWINFKTKAAAADDTMSQSLLRMVSGPHASPAIRVGNHSDEVYSGMPTAERVERVYILTRRCNFSVDRTWRATEVRSPTSHAIPADPERAGHEAARLGLRHSSGLLRGLSPGGLDEDVDTLRSPRAPRDHIVVRSPQDLLLPPLSASLTLPPAEVLDVQRGNADRSGYLLKKQAHGGMWLRRWYVLRMPFFATYYTATESDSGAAPKAVIHMHKAVVADDRGALHLQRTGDRVRVVPRAAIASMNPVLLAHTAAAAAAPAPDPGAVVSSPVADTTSLHFTVTAHAPDGGESVVWQLQANNQDEKDAWAAALLAAVDAAAS